MLVCKGVAGTWLSLYLLVLREVYVQLCAFCCNNQMCTCAIMLDYHSLGVYQVLTHVMLAGWSLWTGSLRPCWLDR
jgi:hypothetical protein